MFTAGQRIGPYALVRKLGRGGFGEVWLAEKRTELVTKKVAVKLPLVEQVDLSAIKQEASLWEQASGHPNVLPIIDADIYDGQVVIVSEFADGGSLHDWLKLHGRKAPSIAKAVELMLGILSGLVHLHSHRITHRDLKPNNILLHGDTPRITDFGVSRVVDHDSRGTEALGTPIYMSPEAFQKSMSRKTDVWSAGVVFYEMLSGTYPFFDDDVFVLMDAIRTEKAKSLPENIPTYLRELVEKALEKEPTQRFQSAEEMRVALSRYSASGGPEFLSDILTADHLATQAITKTPGRGFLETTTLPVHSGKASGESIETKRRIEKKRRLPAYAVGILVVAILGIGGSLFVWLQPNNNNLDLQPQGAINTNSNALSAAPVAEPPATVTPPPNVEPTPAKTVASRPAKPTPKQSQTRPRRKTSLAPSKKRKITLEELIK